MRYLQKILAVPRYRWKIDSLSPTDTNGVVKEKTQYICQQCGHRHSKWSGRCADCGEWNSVVEERAPAGSSAKRSAPNTVVTSDKPIPVTEVVTLDVPRYRTEVSELDNVLGGGLVPGSVVLLGGEPGVGKSTLLLQAADQYARSGKKVLYASGEESTSQIALRSARLGVNSPHLWVVAETTLETIEAHVASMKPDLLIIDSVQTVYSSQLESQPGSVSQLRDCTFQLVSLAKQTGMAIFLVGHVTKDGNIAGPKVLEHMVDVVLYIESTPSQSFRLLRGIKNRFGATNEIGVFEMITGGMRAVTNPSELFLSEQATAVAGSVVVAAVEGTRSILVELQALVSQTPLAIPRRTTIGFDHNRVSLLVAILEKRAGYRFFDQDIYVNVAGGLRLTETAVDLGVLAALISSFTGRAIETRTVFFGEVGLGGEVRAVPKALERLKEAARIGLRRAVVPLKVAKEMEPIPDLQIIGVEHVQQLADFL